MRGTAPVPDPAIDGLRLAYERTTLAWMRTALSFIGFGFTIDKFLEHRGGRTIGITMIAFGLIALLLFVLQLRQFRQRYPQAPRSIAGFVAALIGVLGIMALILAVT